MYPYLKSDLKAGQFGIMRERICDRAAFAGHFFVRRKGYKHTKCKYKVANM